MKAPYPSWREVRELREALLPFAKAAIDYEPPTSKPYRDEEHIALNITAGHLRKARRVYLAYSESKEPHHARDND